MTPIGLEANKRLIDEKFGLLAKKGTAEMPESGGVIYKAAYYAWYDNLYPNLSEDPSDPDICEELGRRKALKKDMEQKIREDSDKFAAFFADAMKECLDEISKQIDAHCKSMIINIMAPTPGPSGTTLICPYGSVTGTIAANNLSQAGGITVN